MMNKHLKPSTVFGLACVILMAPMSAIAPAAAQEFVALQSKRPGGGGGSGTTTQPSYFDWMSPEIRDAWASGFQGKGVTVTIVDDFSSSYGFSGNLGTGAAVKRHGEWVRDVTSMIAPQAGIASHDFYSGRRVKLARGRNAINLSYGMFAAAGYSASQIGWSAQESSIIKYAQDGQVIIAKAAGNDAIAIGGTNRNGQTDYLNLALVGTQSAIFVGALSRNGTPASLASLASYSNFAGNDVAVQKQFVSVGVRGDLTGLYGTSFAAPIVSGYAAVIGSKFAKASPTQISNQILNTARQDTILNYDPARHGRGEASIARALAPTSIQ